MLGFDTNYILEKVAKPTYFAYRKIHKGKGPENHHFSLKNKKTGRVEKRGQNFIMKNVTFKVSEAGLKRVRKEKRKNVHAGVSGSTYTGNKAKDIEWERVSYNPYKNNYFTDQKGNRVDHVDFAKLTPNGVFIPKSVNEKVAALAIKPATLEKLLPEIISPALAFNRLRRKLARELSHGASIREVGHSLHHVKELKDKKKSVTQEHKNTNEKVAFVIPSISLGEIASIGDGAAKLSWNFPLGIDASLGTPDSWGTSPTLGISPLGPTIGIRGGMSKKERAKIEREKSNESTINKVLKYTGLAGLGTGLASGAYGANAAEKAVNLVGEKAAYSGIVDDNVSDSIISEANKYLSSANTARDIGTAALAVGAGGLGLYGAKKIYDYFNKPEKKPSTKKIEKTAGGPGSGVQENNTAPINMPLTKYVTIMKRTKFMNSKKPFLKNKTIQMSKIKFVGQEKYVPKKLQKFIDAAEKGETWMFEKPIDVTVDPNGDYAVLDGHHRFLIAKHFHKKHIKANIYTVTNKDRTETPIEKVAVSLGFLGKLAPATAKIPGQISQALAKGKAAFSNGNAPKTIKNFAKGTYNLGFGGKTVNNKWDPLYGLKSLGHAKQQYTSGPLKGMFKYDKEGEHIIDLTKKRNIGGYIKDEFSGASRTRGDLMAKVKASHQGKTVGEYLDTASRAQKNKLSELNKMKAMDFIKKHPKLAANYYGRNVIQKGMTLGFPAMAAHDVYSGAANEADPSSSKLGNNLSSLAESAGWALTGPLGLAGSLGAVTGLKSGAKAVGNFISKPNEVPKIDTRLVQSPGRRIYNNIAQNAPQVLQSRLPQGSY